MMGGRCCEVIEGKVPRRTSPGPRLPADEEYGKRGRREKRMKGLKWAEITKTRNLR